MKSRQPGFPSLALFVTIRKRRPSHNSIIVSLNTALCRRLDLYQYSGVDVSFDGKYPGMLIVPGTFPGSAFKLESDTNFTGRIFKVSVSELPKQFEPGEYRTLVFLGSCAFYAARSHN